VATNKTWLMGLDGFSTHWISLPWFTKHVESLPISFVYVIAVSSAIYNEGNTTYVYIVIHENDTPQYGQLLELKETGTRVLATHNDIRIGEEDLNDVSIVPLTEIVVVNREFSHRYKYEMREELIEVPL